MVVATSVRTVIDLPEEQVTRLDAVCRRDGISRAQAVRRAVAAYLDSHQAEDEAFGVWRERDLDGLKYERKARGEWM